jgi:hypothetical protein
LLALLLELQNRDLGFGSAVLDQRKHFAAFNSRVYTMHSGESFPLGLIYILAHDCPNKSGHRIYWEAELLNCSHWWFEHAIHKQIMNNHSKLNGSMLLDAFTSLPSFDLNICCQKKVCEEALTHCNNNKNYTGLADWHILPVPIFS